MLLVWRFAMGINMVLFLKTFSKDFFTFPFCGRQKCGGPSVEYPRNADMRNINLIRSLELLYFQEPHSVWSSSPWSASIRPLFNTVVSSAVLLSQLDETDFGIECTCGCCELGMMGRITH
jgi:hypothetical protein